MKIPTEIKQTQMKNKYTKLDALLRQHARIFTQQEKNGRCISDTDYAVWQCVNLLTQLIIIKEKIK